MLLSYWVNCISTAVSSVSIFYKIRLFKCQQGELGKTAFSFYAPWAWNKLPLYRAMTLEVSLKVFYTQI